MSVSNDPEYRAILKALIPTERARLLDGDWSMVNAAETKVVKGRLNPGRQWVGINNIEFPVQVQPRAGIDMEWVRQLSEFRKEGSEFPPIKVFQTPDGRLIGAEGHHRSLAMFKADEDQILCDVVDGTMEDAIVFAAGSNKSNGIKPMTAKDITKAVEMLLAIDGWWKRSDTSIGEHVGCSKTKVTAIRSRIAARDGRNLPVFTTASDGREYPYRRGPGDEQCHIKPPTEGRKYRRQYKGRKYWGRTLSEVDAQIRDAKAKEASKRLSVKGMKGFLERIAFTWIFPRGKGFQGFSGFYRQDICCVPCDSTSIESLLLAIGQLIAARRYKGDLSARMVVLCYSEDVPAKVIDLYRQEGFEFLTPEELTESLKGQDAS